MPELRLAKPVSDNVSRQDIAMAEIDQEHREAKWTPYCDPQSGWPVLEVDKTVRQATKYIVVDAPVPLWRKVWNWLSRAKRRAK